MKKPPASVIIPNWNRREDLLNCLESLKEQTRKNLETIVVDNGSTDGSAEAVEKKHPETIVIRNKENRGFAEANNTGFRKAGGEYILTLNNDAVAEKTWAAELIKAAESRKDVGMCASRMLLYYERDTIDSAGIAGDRTGCSHDRGFGEKDTGQYGRQEEVFGPCAGAALYKRVMLEDVKLGDDYFDSDYFAYNEDTDLAWRAQLRGWKCLYAPKAVVYHKHSATTAETSPAKIHYITRNSLKTFIKNSSTRNLLILTPYMTAYRLAVIPYYLYTRRATPYLKALWAVAKDLPDTLGKRRIIQSGKTAPAGEVEKWLGMETPLSNLRRANRARKVEWKAKADGGI